ncbi:transcription factor Spi-C-like [Xyrauchen texanus]|uniref:transcription factor Spi-C-like n=1 Tax=Xyrauchen texanus TaxID=154827 RepID=UPI0022421BD4|nr:transcription factor Spi-C-like [Xyrauchen texanus]
METLENDINQDFQDAIDVIQRHSEIHYDTENKYYENVEIQHSSARHAISYYQFTPHFEPPAPMYDWNESLSWSHIVPDASMGPLGSTEPAFYSNLPQRHRKGRKKLRLYEYLHEALHDDNMGDSIQWMDRGSGIFHFISKNKEKLAECWGQRKGNRKAMTYQKMARALRNYSRTGEIVKVRRKLTYQFNPAILQRLSTLSSREMALHQQNSAEHVYYSSAVPDCHYWYGQYSDQDEYDLATVLTMHKDSKTSQ